MTAEPAREAPTLTLAEALAVSTLELAKARVPSPRLDARLLLAEAAGVGPDEVMVRPDARLAPQARERLWAFLGRRARREPVSRILGRREFWSLDFALGPETLDPRPDSETLVEAALALVPDRGAPQRLLDLGTGTGCLLLALLRELPRANGLGVDLSTAACEVARANARSLGLGRRARFRTGDWGRGLEETFNVIVTNPPYIADREFDSLDPEVARYEPRLALSGGADGLDAYRSLVPDLPRLLAPGGHAVIEIGAGQAQAVAALLKAWGLKQTALHRDLGGHERCMVAVAE